VRGEVVAVQVPESMVEELVKGKTGIIKQAWSFFLPSQPFGTVQKHFQK